MNELADSLFKETESKVVAWIRGVSMEMAVPLGSTYEILNLSLQKLTFQRAEKEARPALTDAHQR